MKRILSLFLTLVLTAALLSPAAAAANETAGKDSDWLYITLDPGHGGDGAGGNDPGAISGTYGYQEADLVLKIGLYLKEELETYRNVHVDMTRSDRYGTSATAPLSKVENRVVLGLIAGVTNVKRDGTVEELRVRSTVVNVNGKFVLISFREGCVVADFAAGIKHINLDRVGALNRAFHLDAGRHTGRHEISDKTHRHASSIFHAIDRQLNSFITHAHDLEPAGNPVAGLLCRGLRSDERHLHGIEVHFAEAGESGDDVFASGFRLLCSYCIRESEKQQQAKELPNKTVKEVVLFHNDIRV